MSDTSKGSLMRLDTLIGMRERGALRGDELKILMARLLAVVTAATRLVRFYSPANAYQLVVDLEQALDLMPLPPPPEGWVAKITILFGCMSDRDMGAAMHEIAERVRSGAMGGASGGCWRNTWTTSRPGGHGPDRAALIDAFYNRYDGWNGSMESVLLACDALATAEENAGDATALGRAEGMVEELEATIGAEAANWWRRRLRDLQRERDASISESEAMARSEPS